MDADLAPDSLRSWARLFWGIGVLLLPGLAAADRVLRGRIHLFAAPVFAFSLLPLAAIAFDFGIGLPIHPLTTHALAFGLAGWLGWPRIVQVWRWMSGARPAPYAGRQRSATATGASARRRREWMVYARHGLAPAALLVIVPMLMLVHGLQHVPGDSEADRSTGPADAYPSLARRAVDALQGDQYPYPIHVDEHVHIAFMAQIDRDRSAEIVDPYTKLPGQRELFSVEGMRSERGFDVAIVQFHHLTGLSLAAIARWLPAIWAGHLGITVWLALRPAPGAAAAAALVAILPSDVRFLGVAYLIPSPFALPWLMIVLLVAQRASGASRFFGLLLLITAAHFMHLVIGVLSILIAIAATLTRDDARGRRAGMLLAALLPLVWILPNTLRDAEAAVSRETTLPFDTHVFLIPGVAVYVLAAAGTVLAWLLPQRANQPHRAISLALIPISMSLLLSIRFLHASDATYSRQMFAFFLLLGCLAAYGLAEPLRRLWSFGSNAWTAREAHPERAAALGGLRHVVVAVAVAAILAVPLHTHLNYEPYRVHSPASWDAAQVVAHTVGPGDVFLSHPWEAPIYNSLTGATPYTVLRPGSPAERGAEWTEYLRTEGADADWFNQRKITVVIAPIPPDAPHTVLGPNVYRIG